MNRTALLSLLVAVLSMTGCETVNEWLEPTPEAPPPIARSVIEPYFDMLGHLVNNDPEQQAAIFRRARNNWQTDPSARHDLAYALALSTPGHADTDVQAAQTLFSQLLANPRELTPEELEITRVFMAYARHWQQLTLSRNDLATELARTKEDSRQARDSQMQELRGQLNTLREQLKDAESKLDAIANIEREMERLEPERN